MRRSHLLLVMVALTISACADSPLPTDPGAEVASPVAAFVEGQYPTEEEYLAAGGSLTGELSGTRVTGQFSADLSSWSATGSVSYNFANEVAVDLTTQVVSTAGKTINSGGQSYNYGSTIPVLIRRTVNLTSAISTNNNKCGITGKARLIGNASLTLIKNPWGISKAWHNKVDESAPEVTLPPCPPDPCATTPPPDDKGGEAMALLTPDGPSLSCSSDGGGGGSSGGSGDGGGGKWVSYSITTCYGYHYFDENGYYLYSQIDYCVTDYYYYYQEQI